MYVKFVRFALFQINHFFVSGRHRSLLRTHVFHREKSKFAFEKRRVHIVPGPPLDVQLVTFWNPVSHPTIILFQFTEACCMAFTPQSSPTRVSTISYAISFYQFVASYEARIQSRLVCGKPACCTRQNILFGVNGIYCRSALTMLIEGHRFNDVNWQCFVLNLTTVR